jgi:hypothetical protein
VEEVTARPQAGSRERGDPGVMGLVWLGLVSSDLGRGAVAQYRE